MRLDLLCNQDDRRPLLGVLVTLLRHHPHRPLAPLQSVPPLSSLLCHGSNLLTKGVPGKPRQVQGDGREVCAEDVPRRPDHHLGGVAAEAGCVRVSALGREGAE